MREIGDSEANEIKIPLPRRIISITNCPEVLVLEGKNINYIRFENKNVSSKGKGGTEHISAWNKIIVISFFFI